MEELNVLDKLDERLKRDFDRLDKLRMRAHLVANACKLGYMTENDVDKRDLYGATAIWATYTKLLIDELEKYKKEAK